MPAIFYALIAYIGWGSGDIFGTIATRKIGAYLTSFWSYLFSFLLQSLYIPFALNDLSKLTPEIFILNIFLGILLLVAFVLFNEALRVGNPSLVGAISGSFASLVVILSIIFLRESINTKQVLAIVVIFIGFIFSTIDFKLFKNRSLAIDKGIILAVLTMLCWGVYFTFIKIPVKEIGWFWPNYISGSVFPLLGIYMLIKKIKFHSPTYKQAMFPLVAEATLVSSGALAYNLASNIGLTSIVAPIAGAYPTLFVVLAFLVFKDRITKQQIAGIITTLIGIVLLSIFSV